MAADELPLISCRAPDFGARFVASLEAYGFGALVDHPLDMNRVRRIYREWNHYFASGEASAYPMDPERQDGYFSVRVAEHAKGSPRRDHKEYFQFYTWGRCPEHLRHNLWAHYQHSVAFAAELLGHIERAAPQGVIDAISEPLSGMITDSQQSMLRVLHYPPVPTGRSVLRAAPHEDINLLTLLPAADGPGLELQLRSGEWISVPHSPGQLIVNIGDMLQEATGGYLPSTSHRVATPDTEQPAVSRMSLPLFLHPRPDVVLSSRYTARQYLMQRLDELGVA